MDFGVFDHLDTTDGPLDRYYEERLQLVHAYERAGFHAYHVAEHHLSDLGMAPSPSVFLAAVAQRTKRLRFGPMVYAAPMYHPLRLLQEICMLDNLSGGRLDLGFGRGAAAAEIRFFDIDPAEAEAHFRKTVDYILTALKEGAVDATGEGGAKHRMRLTIPPLQKPHPPLWYGLHSPESAPRAAKQRMNVIGLDTVREQVPCFERFSAEWKALYPGEPLPKMGIGRFVYVGRTREEALAVSRRAYKRWHESFVYLSSRMGWSHRHSRPAEFDAIEADGRAITGTPEQVAEAISTQMAATHCNYFVGQFAFGNMTHDEALRSLQLFTSKVVPKLGARLPVT
jgi:alkanesulfonate monooxygenase SsuD/methylene tetrahydromethanopterin reductase-like flavin-dependent oxidoreductase (luciferase family)